MLNLKQNLQFYAFLTHFPDLILHDFSLYVPPPPKKFFLSFNYYYLFVRLNIYSVFYYI